MTAPTLLREIESRGVAARIDDGELKLRPASRLDSQVLAELRALKPEIIALLKQREYSQRAIEPTSTRSFIAGELYNRQAATAEAWRAFDAGEVSAEQRDNLLAYARQ